MPTSEARCTCSSCRVCALIGPRALSWGHPGLLPAQLVAVSRLLVLPGSVAFFAGSPTGSLALRMSLDLVLGTTWMSHSIKGKHILF